MTPNSPVAEVLRAPYTRILRAAEEGGFDCSVLEFPGCFATGDDAAEAMANLEEAMTLWIELEHDQGHDIPPPLALEDYSGRLTLRLAPSLHHDAELRARIEGVSLNRWLATAIAQATGRRSGGAAADPAANAAFPSGYRIAEEPGTPTSDR